MNIIKELTAGTFGGCAGIVVGQVSGVQQSRLGLFRNAESFFGLLTRSTSSHHWNCISQSQPLDTVKVRLQSERTSHLYRGSVDCLRQITVKEGVSQTGCFLSVWLVLRYFMDNHLTIHPITCLSQPSALFKGLAAPLVFNAPLNAVLFASYGHALRTLDSSMGKTEAEKAGNKDLLKLTIAGGWSGLLQCAITVPMELIKVRQQVHHGTGPTPGAVQVARELVQAHGWRMGLFRGWWATVLRDIPSFAAYFIAYEKAKEMLGRLHVSMAGPPVIAPGATASQVRAAKEGTDQPWVLMAAGAAAGVATWTVTYPVDVVKTACQTLPKSTPYHEATATAVARRLYT